jgi:integrase/recombinase XerD
MQLHDARGKRLYPGLFMSLRDVRRGGEGVRGRRTCPAPTPSRLVNNPGYLTAEERAAFLAAAAKTARPVRTLCGVLHAIGCRVSEALALTPEGVDLTGRTLVFESLKKHRPGIYRAVPVPSSLLGQLNLMHGGKEAQRRGKGHADRLLSGLGPG